MYYNKTHRENGQVECEYYFLNDKRHRTDGPAVIYYLNGQVSSERYFLNDEYHRTDGPAVIYYDGKGKIWNKEWHLNSNRYTETKYNSLVKTMHTSLSYDI